MGRSSARTGLWYVTGPIAYTGHAAIKRDTDDLKAALTAVKVEGVFLPVVAPGSVAPGEPCRPQEMGADPPRCDQRGDQRAAGGTHPLSRVLGKLERPAHQRRARPGHRRSDPAPQGRWDLARNGQPAPRA